MCLGFDVPEGFYSEINYSAKRLELDWKTLDSADLDAAKAEAIRLSTTKFDHWSYEEETRLFLALKEQDADGRFWCPFNEIIRLREIIVGPVSDLTRGDIHDALDPADSDVELFKARLAFQKYKVVRQHRADLWK